MHVDPFETALRVLRPARVALVVWGSTLASVVWAPARAHACGGPCAQPELWSLQPNTGGLTAVTNFGLLGQDAEGWVLACEEHIGGILLDVKASGNWLVALTDSGVWLSDDGVCSWTKGPTSERSAWFLDSAVGVATASAPALLVLAPDALRQNIKLERSNGDVFEIVHEFAADVAYRHLVASETLEHIYVAGYSQSPRTWNLSYSLDAGQSFVDVVPSEVDNTLAVMVPKRVYPTDPSRVFVTAQTQSGSGDELWLFDTNTNTTTLLTKLEDNEVLSNMAFLDGQVWLAGRRNGGGSLYRAELTSLAFTRVVNNAPSLACLEAVNSTLMTCANDYSYDSAFLLASVDVERAKFEPQMRVADLVGLRSCDEKCAATQDWLETTYGPSPVVDAGAMSPNPAPMPDTEPTPQPRRDSSGCSLGPAGAPLPVSASLLVVALVLARSLSKRHISMAH